MYETIRPYLPILIAAAIGLVLIAWLASSPEYFQSNVTPPSETVHPTPAPKR